MSKDTKNIILFNSNLVRISQKPFRYFILDHFFSERYGFKLLKWLETKAPWKLKITDFYEQFEFSFYEDYDFPKWIKKLIDINFLRQIKSYMENIFQITLEDKIDVDAHKLTKGQAIAVHNDYVPNMNYETHRLVIQLNRGWDYNKGGILMTFNSNSLDNVDKIIKPTHNCCFGFEIGKNSYHAVSPINSGERFTIIFSFYQKKSI
jgi:Rps23 Pro-64 3,4-dihydroxylase Tpa1-like proline 4-hydroxylase